MGISTVHPDPGRTISGIRLDQARDIVHQLRDANLGALFDGALTDEPAAERRFGETLLIRLLEPQIAADWQGQPPLDDIKNAVSRYLGLIAAPSPKPTIHKASSGFSTLREVVGQIAPGVAHENGLLRPSAPIPSQLPVTRPWRQYASEAGFQTNLLKRAEREILDMVNRVVIQQAGWGCSDSQRHLRTECKVSPKRMSKHGGRLSERSYQRGLNSLIDLNLLIVNSITMRGARNVTPAWWAGVSTTDPVLVWILAARRQEEMTVDN